MLLPATWLRLVLGVSSYRCCRAGGFAALYTLYSCVIMHRPAVRAALHPPGGTALSKHSRPHRDGPLLGARPGDMTSRDVRLGAVHLTTLVPWSEVHYTLKKNTKKTLYGLICLFQFWIFLYFFFATTLNIVTKSSQRSTINVNLVSFNYGIQWLEQMAYKDLYVEYEAQERRSHTKCGKTLPRGLYSKIRDETKSPRGNYCIPRKLSRSTFKHLVRNKV